MERDFYDVESSQDEHEEQEDVLSSYNQFFLQEDDSKNHDNLFLTTDNRDEEQLEKRNHADEFSTPTNNHTLGINILSEQLSNLCLEEEQCNEIIGWIIRAVTSFTSTDDIFTSFTDSRSKYV